MRRCIAIVLLALLPFQFTWASAWGFCAHADGTPPSLSAASGDAVFDALAPAIDDADPDQTPVHPESQVGCEQCPCHAFGLIEASAAQRAIGPARRCFESCQAPAEDAVQAQPERPQWAALA